ncbi:MAG: hypothetical protein AABO57_03855 [Acidobacteriota bacterium]
MKRRLRQSSYELPPEGGTTNPELESGLGTFDCPVFCALWLGRFVRDLSPTRVVGTQRKAFVEPLESVSLRLA